MGNELSNTEGQEEKTGLDQKSETNEGPNGHIINNSSNKWENGVTCESAVKSSSGPSTEAKKQEPVLEIVVPEAKAVAEPLVTVDSPKTNTQKDEEAKVETAKAFNKLFKKKSKPDTENGNKKSRSTEDQTDTVPQTNSILPVPTGVTKDKETSEEQKTVYFNLSPKEEEIKDIGKDSHELVENQEGESQTEENPVMNFFKTFATKTAKQASATPDTTKEQAQKEAQPTATTTTMAQVVDAPPAPKGMSIPPPPPPEPPKMEIKSASAAAKSSPKEEPKAATKEKTAKESRLGKLFRAKTSDVVPEPVVEKAQPVKEVSQPVVVDVQKVDASKTSTLEAAAKPEPPPAVPEEPKNTPPKAAPFLSLFKPKTTSAEPKKETPAPPPTADAVPNVKPKEEAAAAKSPEATADNDSVSGVSQTDESAANSPRKLEKRNSIHLFFKTLGQKGKSDAGVQKEPEKTQ